MGRARACCCFFSNGQSLFQTVKKRPVITRVLYFPSRQFSFQRIPPSFPSNRFVICTPVRTPFRKSTRLWFRCNYVQTYASLLSFRDQLDGNMVFVWTSVSSASPSPSSSRHMSVKTYQHSLSVKSYFPNFMLDECCTGWAVTRWRTSRMADNVLGDSVDRETCREVIAGAKRPPRPAERLCRVLSGRNAYANTLITRITDTERPRRAGCDDGCVPRRSAVDGEKIKSGYVCGKRTENARRLRPSCIQ